MTTYELLLSAHILCVVAWLGATLCIQALSLRAMRASPARTVDVMADTEWVGRRLLAPASLLAAVFGALLANEAGYSFSDTWIVIALAAVAASSLVGAAYVDPQSGRIQRLAAERGPAHPTVLARIQRVLLVSRIELLLLLAVVVVDMVVKPGL
jgi:uncharacterized membrane protein